jgi:hypothetical protein
MDICRHIGHLTTAAERIANALEEQVKQGKHPTRPAENVVSRKELNDLRERLSVLQNTVAGLESGTSESLKELRRRLVWNSQT